MASATSLPREKKPWQRWILYTQEADNSTFPQYANPNFMGKFDARAGSYKLHTISANHPFHPILDWLVTSIKIQPAVEDRKLFACAFFSNTVASTRLHFARNLFDALDKRLGISSVHSYGKGLTTPNLNESVANVSFYGMKYDRKIATASNYMFMFAFENSRHEDYVTEKLFHAYLSGAVPVYWGAPNVADFEVAPNSIIDASKFENVEDLANYLVSVSKNKTALAQFNKWRSQPPSTWRFRTNETNYQYSTNPWKELCEYLHGLRLCSKDMKKSCV